MYKFFVIAALLSISNLCFANQLDLKSAGVLKQVRIGSASCGNNSSTLRISEDDNKISYVDMAVSNDVCEAFKAKNEDLMKVGAVFADLTIAKKSQTLESLGGEAYIAGVQNSRFFQKGKCY